jgi:sec-independent protein translocase protein TatC
MDDRPDHQPTRMSLREHFEELRGCLFRALIGLVVGTVVCWFLKAQIMEIVRRPLLQSGFPHKLVSWSPMESIVTYLKMSILAGAVLSSPWITYQMWRFIGAGLYPKERSMCYQYAGGASLLFLIGVAFSYFVMTPLILSVLLNFQPADAIEQQMQTSRYFNFFFKFTLAMGISFQVPMVMRFLSAVGLVDRSAWVTYRKYAIVSTFFIAALITPPEPLSQISAALPMILLYEVGILLIPAESSSKMEDREQDGDTSEHDERQSGDEPEGFSG